jgi:hypothetical protein
MKKTFSLYLILIALSLPAFSQSDSTSKINISTDIVNRYIWRGLDYGRAPSIQPTFSFIRKNLEIGSWGAFNTNGSYHEVDLYAKYTIWNFNLAFTDYFVHNETNSNHTHYFDYNAKSTNHAFEGSLQYKISDKIPLSILAAVYFYGNDRAWGYDAAKDSTSKNYYSTYVEFGYTLTHKEKTIDFFIGLTPFAGAYGNTFGVINAGISSYRKIPITDKFQLPVKASLIANPQAGNLYFVIGFTL